MKVPVAGGSPTAPVGRSWDGFVVAQDYFFKQELWFQSTNTLVPSSKFSLTCIKETQHFINFLLSSHLLDSERVISLLLSKQKGGGKGLDISVFCSVMCIIDMMNWHQWYQIPALLSLHSPQPPVQCWLLSSKRCSRAALLIYSAVQHLIEVALVSH